MPDLLTTSLTGMRAFQRALDVTGHNIANANTPGYSRQVVDFVSRGAQASSAGFIGSGVKITAIRRMYDSLLGQQMQTAATQQTRFSTLNDLSSRVDSLLADADTGLNSSMQSFFGALQDLANDPSSLPTRSALIGEAEGLVSRLRSLDQQLAAIDNEVSGRLKLSVAEINQAAEGIADLNDKIALTRGGPPPNDLLDARDQLVTALSEQISVSTTLQDDGTMNVFIGSGQSLVVGSRVQRLGIVNNEFDPTRLDVTYEGSSGSTTLNTALTGGALGGLLEFRSRILDPTLQSLGQTAVTLADAFNTQHSSGLDLRGNLGGDFFSIDGPGVLPSSANTGAPTAAVSISDFGALTGGNYVLEYDGAAWSLRDEATNMPVTLTGSGTAADPFVADGLSIEVGGAPAAGDSFLIRPTQDASGSLTALISDPQAIAAAAPTRTAADFSNTGDASISPPTVYDPQDPLLLNNAVIEFTTPNTYSINGAGAYLYVDGGTIAVNGSSFTIDGTPGVGDTFTLSANFGATGDNGNALNLGAIQSTGILDGGNISIGENYSQLVSTVGSATFQIQASLDAQNVVLANAENALLERAGVNLDEEATNLIRYQQAYQAAAQVVSVTKNLFDTLLGATRR
ncbi:MAG: flagellar hook-associated protein FlgK [Woeseiaceae bacterium]|nr:flagellar hook-associated protein FlgK [Woeseiaceae bacterium]